MSAPFTHLPERVDPKDMVASHPADPPREYSIDGESEFVLRYGAAGDD